MRAFILGALGYPLLELLYRQRTHYAMSIAGGLSLCWIQRVSRTRHSLLSQALVSTLGITALEYACGCIWNRKHQVWDYSKLPFNYNGQVCIGYSALWFLLSLTVLSAKDVIDCTKQPDS